MRSDTTMIDIGDYQTPKANGSRSDVPEGPLLSQLAGMREARAWGEMVAADLAAYRAGRIDWTDVDPGCVLYGAPGTGKTTFARALAATCQVPLIATSYANWQKAHEGHLGDLTRAMERDFAKARSSAPCVLFIDELDTLPSRTIGNHNRDWWTAVVNALLELLDGIAERPGVIVITACNHPDRLDDALVRAGRLDRKIEIPLPALEDLPDILRFHLKADAARIGDLSSVAVLCVGSSGADINKLVREARRIARSGNRPLQREDLVAALERATPPMSDMDRRRVAIHEAGHAVAALRLGVSRDITISIMPNKGNLGRVLMDNPRVLTRAVIDNLLTVLLAGRAAEEVMLNDPSGGAGGGPESDLARASALAFRAVATLGLSTQGSITWHGHTDPNATVDCPPHLSREVDEKLRTALERARLIIHSEREFTERIASELIARRALTHAQIAAVDPRYRQAPDTREVAPRTRPHRTPQRPLRPEPFEVPSPSRWSHWRR